MNGIECLSRKTIDRCAFLCPHPKEPNEAKKSESTKNTDKTNRPRGNEIHDLVELVKPLVCSSII